MGEEPDPGLGSSVDLFRFSRVLVLGGDFNTTLEEQDCSGTEQSSVAADTLREIVEHHSLVDIWHDHHPDDTSIFTFVRVEAHWSSHSHLDRIYLSRFHLSQAHSSSIQLAPFSDHHLATVTASLCVESPGLAYWHFNNRLLEDEGFVTSFQEFWLTWRGQQRAFPSARRWWDLGKVRARLFCRDYTRGTSQRRNAAIEQLEWEVLELERRLAASPEDPLLCGVCWEKREELWALEDPWARGAFVRSRIHLLREMDRGSHFFYALEKTRGAKKHVTCLLAEDGTPLTEQVEMCGRDRAFYASLFSPDLTDPGTCRVLWEELPTLGSVLADVIHPDQTYTIPDCSIFDNLFLVRDLLELGRRDGLSFALPSLDQEKAFDRVDHVYLLNTLRAFGFGPQFVGFLRVLYASTECLVKLNWTLTEPVSFGRLTGLVLRELELWLVLSAYADDVLLVVQDSGDLVWVEACQAIYSAASSPRVNWVKSSGLAETHTDLAAEDSWRPDWGDRVYFSHLTVRTAGVVTLFSPDIWPEVLRVAEAVLGRLLQFQVHMEGLVVNLVNVYAPTSGPEQLQFYQQTSALLGTLESHECLVLGGDFNTTLEEWDHSGTEQSLVAADTLREIVEHRSLVDVWCNHHPDDISTFTFVWMEAHRSRHSRLDRIYLS
ncbi:unnamed protein product [Caretta caretta]